MTNPQPTPAALRELREQGLTVGDIARLFGLHPQAVIVMLEERHVEEGGTDAPLPRVVESILDSAHRAQRRDLRKEVPGVALRANRP